MSRLLCGCTQGSGMPLWARSLEHMVSVPGGPWKGGLQAWAGALSSLKGWQEHHWMSPHTHTVDTPRNKSKKKPNPAHRNQKPPSSCSVPPAPSVDKALYHAYCKGEMLKESSPSVITVQVLKVEFVTERQYIGKCPSRTDIFPYPECGWRHTSLISVPMGTLLLVWLSLKVLPFESPVFMQVSSSHSPLQVDSRASFLYPHGL